MARAIRNVERSEGEVPVKKDDTIDHSHPGAQFLGSNRRRVLVLLLVITCIAALAVTFAWRSTTSNNEAQSGPTAEQQVARAVDYALKKAAGAPSSASVVYRTIAPSLVIITNREQSSGAPTSVKDIGLGTGVIINEAGAILTANHVIGDASSIRLVFADGTKANGRVVSQDPEKDIAVLEADAAPEVIVPAVMGGGVNIGDEVFAVGHPLGLVSSLTAGVVSGLGRTVPIDDSTKLEDLIQFDAAVNPGSSGGPLLNRTGQVVGIVTALANPSGQHFFVGIGFAVPIATAAGAAGGPSQ